jgi:uncharacterized protein YjbJ (UPF0337 family)
MEPNKNKVKGSWQQLKGKVKQKWAKLTDDDLLAAEGNIDEIKGRIQKAYGYTQERAQDELVRFKKEHNLN